MALATYIVELVVQAIRLIILLSASRQRKNGALDD